MVLKEKRPLAGPPIARAIHLRITGLSDGSADVMQVKPCRAYTMHVDGFHVCAGISPSLRVEMSDLELSPFHDKGGPVKAYQVLGKDLQRVLDELNGALAA
jgi:hypothetical protein